MRVNEYQVADMTAPPQPTVKGQPHGKQQRQIETLLLHGRDGSSQQVCRNPTFAVRGRRKHVADAADLHHGAVEPHRLAEHL